MCFKKAPGKIKLLKWNWKLRSFDVHPLSKKELNLTEKWNILEQSASVLRRCIIQGLSDTKQSKAGKCHLVFTFGKISDNRPDPKLVQPLFEIKYHCLPKYTGLFLMAPAQFRIGRKRSTELSISAPRWRLSWNCSNMVGWELFSRQGTSPQYQNRYLDLVVW